MMSKSHMLVHPDKKVRKKYRIIYSEMHQPKNGLELKKDEVNSLFQQESQEDQY